MLHQFDILNIIKIYQILLWKNLSSYKTIIYFYKTIVAILLKITNYKKKLDSLLVI